jgi:uroporphyrinogen-III decarboxylase
MNSYERFVKTINWEIPDRLMTYDVIDHRELLERFGGEGSLVERNARMARRIGLDVMRGIYDPENHWVGSKVKDWIRFFDVDPANWEVVQTGGTAWIAKRPFRDLQGLEKHMPRMPRKSEVEEWYKADLKSIKGVFDAYDLVFIGAVEGPITDACMYADMELFCEAIYDAPELVDQLMEVCGTFSQYMAEVFVENPTAPMVFMGEDIAGKSGPLFSLEFIRKKGLPIWKRIVQPVKDRGFKLLYHTDGRARQLLPIIVNELGADGFNPIERNGCNDIFEIRRHYPKTLLFGNVCCEVTLPHGTPEDVELETRELIEKIGPQGGILIGSSSEVHDLVPVENALRMYETVRRYGRYPIQTRAC